MFIIIKKSTITKYLSSVIVYILKKKILAVFRRTKKKGNEKPTISEQIYDKSFCESKYAISCHGFLYYSGHGATTIVFSEAVNTAMLL